MTKPKHPLCWSCNRKFRGASFTVVTTDNGPVNVHKQCAEEMERTK